MALRYIRQQFAVQQEMQGGVYFAESIQRVPLDLRGGDG